MAHYNTILHSLSKFLPRHVFDTLEQKFDQSDRRRKSSRYEQFIALLTAQILGLNSLREIEAALKCKQKKLYHVGVKKPISRSALARMNYERTSDFFKVIFENLLKHAQKHAPKLQFNLPGIDKLILLDATTIELCLNEFPWATYKETKGAIKLHFGLNDSGHLPEFMVATDGKTHEVSVAKSLEFAKGSMICMDRGYNDYKWWDELDSNGIFFVTRLKSNAVYEGIRRKPGRRSKNVNDDEIVMLNGSEKQFRLVHYTDPETQREYHFITNANKLPAQTIANIYKERWQIELFFKWVKQNLKIKTFLGTSANAVMTQIWIALCLYLILSLIKFVSKTEYSIREILNWICLNLFSNSIMEDFLVPKMTEPIKNQQLELF